MAQLVGTSITITFLHWQKELQMINVKNVSEEILIFDAYFCHVFQFRTQSMLECFNYVHNSLIKCKHVTNLTTNADFLLETDDNVTKTLQYCLQFTGCQHTLPFVWK